MDIVIIISTLVGSAFFSAIEIAFISVNKTKMVITQSAQRFINWDTLSKESVQFITAMLVGNNFCLVVYGFFAGRFIIDHMQWDWVTSSAILSLLAQVLISTPIIIIMAEFLPKTLGYRYNRYTLKLLMPVAFLMYRILKFLGVSALTSSVSGAVLRNAKKNIPIEKSQEDEDFEKKKFQDILRGVGDESNYLGMLMRMSEKVLGFNQLRVRDCMISSIHIESFDIQGNIEALKSKFVDTGFSRIVIYDGSMDKVLGYVHAFDMIKQTPKDIKSILIDLPRLYETVSVKEALKQLTGSNKSIALVMDEYGNTSGLVAVEDMIEQIFDDIEDEHDVPTNAPPEIKEDSKGDYIIQASIKIEDLNDYTDFNFPISGEYETLAGLILYTRQDIPKVNERFILHELQVEVLDATPSAVHTVRLKKE